MGTCCSAPNDDDEVDDQRNYEKQFPTSDYYKRGFTQQEVYKLAVDDLQQIERSPVLAHALHSAGDVANAIVHIELLDPGEVEEKIRYAKGQMKTITVRNNCLYIDYELVGRIPPGTIVRAY